MNSGTDIVSAIEKLGVHDHLCLIYETREEQFAAVIPFMRVGLEKGERCIYIADDNTADSVFEAMRSGGIDVDSALRSGALSVIGKRDAYLKEGYFDPELMIGLLKVVTEEAKNKGFSALRVTGEMTWMLGGDPGTERLIEYEAKLNYFFPKHDALAICQYNRKRFKPEIIIEVIKTHPLVIYGGEVCKNFYYVPPDEFLKPEQPSREADRLLKNVKDREQAEKSLQAEIREHEKSEKMLRKSNELLERVFSSIHVHLAYMDKDFKFIRVNRAYAAADERDTSFFIGKNHFDLYPDKENEAIFREVVRTGEPYIVFEKPFVYPEHRERGISYLDWSLQPVKGTGGKVEGLILSLLNVTDRVKAMEAVRNSEAQLREAQRVARLGSWDWDAETDIITWSDELYLIFGLEQSLPTPNYQQHLKLYTAESAARLSRAVEKAMQAGEPYELDLEQVRRDGSRRWVTARGEAKRDVNGRIVGLRGTAQDITERKRAEEELLRLNRFYNVLSRTNQVLVRAQNRQDLFDEACKIAVEQGAFLMAWIGEVDETTHFIKPVAMNGNYGNYLRDISISVDDIPEGRGPTGKALREGRHSICRDIEHEPYMEPWRKTALSMGYRSSAAFPLVVGGTVKGVYTVYAPQVNWFNEEEIRLLDELAADISYALDYLDKEELRKRAEAERNRLIHTLGERIKELTALRHAALILQDTRKDTTEVLQHFAGILPAAWQYPEITAVRIKYDLTDVSSPNFSETTWSQRADFTTSDGKQGSVEAVYLQEMPVEYEGPFLAEERDLIKSVADMLQSYLERKRAEEALKLSYVYNRSLIEASLDPLVTISAQGKITDANAATEKVTGRNRAELIGTDFSDYFTEPDKAREGYKQVFEIGFVRDYSLEIRHRDGHLIPVLYNAGVYKDEAGKVIGVFAAARDVTERKLAEERLKEEMNVTANLLMIAEATSSIMDADKLMEHVVECNCKIMGSQVCLTYRWDREARVFRPDREYGLLRTMVPLFVTELLDKNVTFVKRVLEANEPVIVEEFQETNKENVFSWLGDIHTVVVTPLTSKRRNMGLLISIYNFPRKFNEWDKRVMRGIASQVSIALEQADLYAQSIDRAIELSHKMETIQVMHEMDKSLLSTLEPQAILETVIRMVSRIVSCDGTAVILVDNEKKGFIYKAGYGLPYVTEGVFIPFAETIASEIIETGIPQYIANLAEMKDLLPLEVGLLKEGFLSHIRTPIIVKNEVIGILTVESKRGTAFTSGDLSTVEKLASQIGVALQNAKQLTDLEELLIGTVKSLSSAIEAKSHWTAGHSERVSMYALAIAEKMGFSERETKDLELAAILHDIGKIGTYEAILDKPDTLTEEELAIMKRHPDKGIDILAPVRRLSDVIPAIKHHHEHYDGLGYPDGLKGDEIPLSARILALADAVDAMSSDRPYRKGMAMDLIISELKILSGSQFDPKVVEAFLKTVAGR